MACDHPTDAEPHGTDSCRPPTIDLTHKSCSPVSRPMDRGMGPVSELPCSDLEGEGDSRQCKQGASFIVLAHRYAVTQLASGHAGMNRDSLWINEMKHDGCVLSSRLNSAL